MDYTNGLPSNEDRIAALERELAEFKNAIRKQHNGYLHPNDPVMGPEPESEFAAMMELFIEGKAFANSDRVIDMERELAEAKKDTARLDWINRNGDRLADALMTRWIKQNINIRAAIDEAKDGE